MGKTGGHYNAGTDAKFKMTIYNILGESCTIDPLHDDDDNNNRQRDETNYLDGGELRGCKDFEMPDSTIDYLHLEMDGIDGWYCQWYKIFIDNVEHFCDYDDWVDTNAHVNIYCN